MKLKEKEEKNAQLQEEVTRLEAEKAEAGSRHSVINMDMVKKVFDLVLLKVPMDITQWRNELKKGGKLRKSISHPTKYKGEFNMYCYLKVSLKENVSEQDVLAFKNALKSKGYTEKDAVFRNGCAYIRCNENKTYEISSLTQTFSFVKNIERIKTCTEYLLYACGITEQNGTSPCLFATVPLALIEKYTEKPDHDILLNRFKKDNFCVDGYMLIKNTVVAEQKNIILNKKTVTVFTDVEDS